jgi:hypothetical protein
MCWGKHFGVDSPFCWFMKLLHVESSFVGCIAGGWREAECAKWPASNLRHHTRTKRWAKCLTTTNKVLHVVFLFLWAQECLLVMIEESIVELYCLWWFISEGDTSLTTGIVVITDGHHRSYIPCKWCKLRSIGYQAQDPVSLAYISRTKNLILHTRLPPSPFSTIRRPYLSLVFPLSFIAAIPLDYTHGFFIINTSLKINLLDWTQTGF